MNEIRNPTASAGGIEGRVGRASDTAASADALQALRDLKAGAAAEGRGTMGMDEIAACRRERAAAKG